MFKKPMQRIRFGENQLNDYREVQAIAKSVLAELRETIRPGETERTIADRSVELLTRSGITETWYYSCPALVLAGSRSILSISGRHYSPSEVPFREFDLITVDLSPCRGSIWGDCARTFFLEEGRVTEEHWSLKYRRGMEFELSLHAILREIARPEMRFDELFQRMNEVIKRSGFENLDASQNLGHSLEQKLDDRKYIEASNRLPLGSARFFTFEPHVRFAGESWGFKHENVYYFDGEGVLQEL